MKKIDRCAINVSRRRVAVIKTPWHANDYQPTGLGCIAMMTVAIGFI